MRAQQALSAASHHAVAVVDGHDQLLEVPPGVLLQQASLAHHQLEHVPVRGILHGYGQVLRCQEDLSSIPSPVSCIHSLLLWEGFGTERLHSRPLSEFVMGLLATWNNEVAPA